MGTKDENVSSTTEKDKLIGAFERLLSECSVQEDDNDSKEEVEAETEPEAATSIEKPGEESNVPDTKEEERREVELDYFPKVEYPKYRKEFDGIEEESSGQDDNVPSTDVLVDSDSDSDYPKPISQKSDKDSTDANVTEQKTDHVAEQEKSDIAESTDSLETKKNGDFHDKITSEANIVAEEIECKKSEMDKTAEEENSKESIEENKKPEISEEMKVAESADFLNLMKTQEADKSNR